MKRTSFTSRRYTSFAGLAGGVGLCLFSFGASPQADYTNTVTYRHNRHIGQDAMVWQLRNSTGTSPCPDRPD